MKVKLNKAQTMVEYALLIVIAIAALLTMRIYLLRIVQEKFRQTADVFGSGEQFARNLTKVSSKVEGIQEVPEQWSYTRTCDYALNTVALLSADICGCYDPGFLGNSSHYHPGVNDRIAFHEGEIANITAQINVAKQDGNLTVNIPYLEHMAESLNTTKSSLEAQRQRKQDRITYLKQTMVNCFSAAELAEHNLCQEMKECL
jgi:hypothetical protein